jgi:hypothetical protein
MTAFENPGITLGEAGTSRFHLTSPLLPGAGKVG